MNRTLRESVTGAGRNISLDHRRRLSLNGVPGSKDSNDDYLDLFSKSRRSLSVASSDESDVSVKLGRLSIGSAKPGKSGLDDLLSPIDGGKHDYDWLLTPPGTPLVPTSDGNESKTGLMAPRSGPLVRSISTNKASRLSASHSENNHPTKATRSRSASRPSVSSSQYSTYSNKSNSILNTSSASVSSYIRPSTPTSRSSSITRPSTPSRPSVSISSTPSRPSVSVSVSRSSTPSRPSMPRSSTPTRPSVPRSSTPSKPRPALSTSSIDNKPRPSTPTSRPQITASLNHPAPRSTSRPSTPTRRNSAPSLSSASGPSTPGGRSFNNGCTAASASRPSSPSPRVQAPPQPIVLHDFLLETPPNLRTTLPDRPISAGRSRPGLALTSKGNTDSTTSPATVSRRQSSPLVTRGRLTEADERARSLSKGPLADIVDSCRELSTRKLAKTSTDSTGFGRTISKKSLDMAIRHMDIRNGSNGLCPLAGSNLFPQSIRSTNHKIKPGAGSPNGHHSISSNSTIAENGSRFSGSSSEEDKSQSSDKLTKTDIYGSSRYDMLLLKEDVKNMSWLHSIDDKSAQGSVFDNGFELLPEPFDP